MLSPVDIFRVLEWHTTRFETFMLTFLIFVIIFLMIFGLAALIAIWHVLTQVLAEYRRCNKNPPLMGED